ncbi:MAG: hypothetical protein RBS99_10265 [Rhodospirillales bacterium]|jgi:hypothetical protein|nr:hypothetical protein [Rhodospirillales bacterium]
MTFQELPLYEAIHDVYRLVRSPRSDEWMTLRAEELCRIIQGHLPIGHPFQMRQMLAAWSAYGKSPSSGNGSLKKLELQILVAKTHGRQCFWANRGKGDCSGEVTTDRLLPGARGGMYTVENCVLACSYHNSQRNDATVEAYLNGSQKTFL